MYFQRIIKNSINNNDYFYRKRKESIPDENIRYNHYIKDVNSNDNDKSDTAFFDNKNNTFNLFLSNKIVSENNIGKFKEKINNRENILEQNYKNLNEYQHNTYENALNLKHNYKNIPKRNTIDASFRSSGKRIYKTGSTHNVFQNNYYLSQLNNSNNITNNILNFYNNSSVGKKKTDITDDNIIQIINDKAGFVDYHNKMLEYQNENKRISEENKNKKKNNKFNTQSKELNQIKMENNYYNSLTTQNLLGKKNSIMRYKNLLDEQVKNNISDKLMRESVTFDDVVQNKFYLKKKGNMTERKFLNKNNFVEINPYNHRNYFLGNSFLQYDTINNPQIKYNYNKYIFPQNNVNNSDNFSSI